MKRQTLYGCYYANFAAFQAAIQDTIDQLPSAHKMRLTSLMTLNFQQFGKRSINCRVTHKSFFLIAAKAGAGFVAESVYGGDRGSDWRNCGKTFSILNS